MIIKKGTQLIVKSTRKGQYKAEATEDFNTDNDWYPVKTLELVRGRSEDWEPGESIPCRASFCSIEVIPGK